jgi:hypothetical protein
MPESTHFVRVIMPRMWVTAEEEESLHEATVGKVQSVWASLVSFRNYFPER